MDNLKPRLDRLGRAVAEVSDAGADDSVLVTARRRFLEREGDSPQTKRKAAWIAFAAAACVAAAIGVSSLRASPRALSFEVGDPPKHGDVGVWIAAERELPVPLLFSEGSRITAAPGARMRVTEMSANGAEVLLERGSVSASVTHASPQTHWALRAGPFEVRVTGTAFDASWDPASESFELVMKEGSVLVSGPLVQTGRVVLAGERLRVSTRAGRMEIGTLPISPDADAIPPAPSAEPSACPPALSAAIAPSAPMPSSSASDASSAPSFHDLLAAGKTREALEAAERDGFAQQLDRASSGELLSLSDAARFASRPAEARDALLAMRRRFGARGRSAFLLGKIAADQLHSTGEAATWFDTYLHEDPNGPLAEQALGRLVEIRRHGDPAVARATAERYLAAYPGGSYAALARSLIGP